MIQPQPQMIESEKHISSNNITAGLISGFLAITGANLLILEAASNGGYTEAETFSWVFATYFFGGVFSIFMPLYYKMPFTCAHSLSGIAYLTTVSHLFSFNELVTGFLFSGLFIFLLGKTGLFHKIFTFFPMEVTSSMLAGMILHTLLSLSSQFWNDLFIVAGAAISFVATSVFLKKIPPIFPALCMSFIIVFFTQPALTVPKLAEASYFHFILPDFSLAAIFVIGLPLCILLLSNDLLVGMNELRKEGYPAERTPIIAYSGLVSIIGSFFGSHCSNLGGIMTSICCRPSAGKKEHRYIASALSGVILAGFALFAAYLIPFILALPKGLPAIIAFLTLFGVFTSSLRFSLSNKSLYAAVIPTFFISASNLHIGVVNGPLLGLLAGMMIYQLMTMLKKRSH